MPVVKRALRRAGQYFEMRWSSWNLVSSCCFFCILLQAFTAQEEAEGDLQPLTVSLLFCVAKLAHNLSQRSTKAPKHETWRSSKSDKILHTFVLVSWNLLSHKLQILNPYYNTWTLSYPKTSSTFVRRYFSRTDFFIFASRQKRHKHLSCPFT